MYVGYGNDGTKNDIYRSYLPLNALPNLAGVSVSKVTFSAYQSSCYDASVASTCYLGSASTAIPASVTWNTKPAITAITSTSLKGNGVWATFDITSALKAPLTTGSAFYGLVLYGSEATPLTYNWHGFTGSGTNAPYVTITCSTLVSPVTGLTNTMTPSTNYFRQTANSAGAITNKDDYPDAGRGNVNLSWTADPNATGYHIYAYDGATYRQVGTTLGRSATTWSSAGAGFYPTDTTIAGYGANGSYSGNPFTAGESPSPATRVSSKVLTYPAGTPYTAKGSTGTGIVVPDGAYIYVKAWGAYPGPAKWVRFPQSNYPSASPTYGTGTLQNTTATVPQSLSAFMLNGVLYDGAVTSATTTSTKIAAYAASSFDTGSTNIGLTFNKPLLAYATAADVAAGYTGAGVMLTTDGTCIYSVGISGQGFIVRQYDDQGNWKSDWTISVANSTAFAYFDGITSDGNNLYLPEWTNTNAARLYKVSLSTHKVTDVWIQSDQVTKQMVGFSYDFTSKRFIGGNLQTGTNVDTFVGPGLDLRDNPSPLYNKQKTVYPTNINYWFRVAAYNADGETGVFSASCAQPTLTNRSVSASNDPDIAYTTLGSLQGLDIQAAEGRAATHFELPGLCASTYGPGANLSCSYTSDMAATSSYLPKGWRFSFEQTITQLSSGAVQYTDGDGIVYLFSPDSGNANAYISPAGMFSTLTKASSGWTLTDADGTRHSFGTDGKITADTDRNGNKTSYSYSSGGAKITAVSGQYISLATSGSTLTAALYAGSTLLNQYTYAISGSNLTVTENATTSARKITDVFTENASGQITSISRYSGTSYTSTLAYSTTSVSLDYAAGPSAPATLAIMAYSSRSTNVKQATLTQSAGSSNNATTFPAATQKQVFLTDPSGQELWSSTSADQVYGTYTNYNAYNQITSTKGPVSVSADGLTPTNVPTALGTVGSTKSDYDSAGNLTYSCDKSQLETWNYYNTANDLIKSIDNNRAVTWYSVDAKGNILVTEKLIAATGARSRTEYTYNSQGLTTIEKDAISKNSDGTYVFDEKDFSNFACTGDPQQTTEKSVQLATGATPQDITTSCTIDNFGHTTSNTDGRGIVTDTSTYDVAGSQLTSTDKTGMTTTDSYDAFGNKLNEYQSPSGSSTKNNWTQSSYDYRGDLLTTSNLDSAGNTVSKTTKGYDCLAREVSSDDNSLPGVVQTTYDSAGNILTQTSEGTEAGTLTTNTYDAAGQELTSKNSLTTGAPTTTTYDPDGNVIQTTTTGQPTQSSTYYQGNEASSTDGQVEDTFVYDLDGNVVSDTQSDLSKSKPAVTTTLTYDLLGRLLTTKMGSQTATTNTYNVRGDLLAKTDFDGITTQYSYDAADNQLTEQVGTDNPTTKTYDAASRITKQVNPDGTEIDYTYDNLSRVTEDKELKGSTLLKDTTTTYDSAGRPSTINESVSGYNQAFSYQNTGTGTAAQTITTKTETFADGSKQTSIINGALFGSDTLTPESGTSYTAATTGYDAEGKPQTKTVGTQSSQLTYDLSGRLTVDTDLSTSGQTTYVYDANDSKLTASNYGRLGSQSAAYTYSPDRTQLASAKVGSTTTAYAYNAATGDITTAGTNGFTYNTAGRLATRTGTAATYAYDSLGRRTSGAGNTYAWTGQKLASVTGASGTESFTYDGTGQRLSKTLSGTTTGYVYDGTKLISTTVSSSAMAQSIIYLYGSSSTPVAAHYSATAGSTVTPLNFEIVSDQRGDVRELRDTNGAAFARYDYDAFGSITSDTEFATTLVTLALAQQISAAQPLRYAGYAWDAETKLYYCSQRYYDPSSASFISRDPAKADGEKSPYMYCAGEPVGGVDPSGMWVSYCYSKKYICEVANHFKKPVSAWAVAASVPQITHTNSVSVTCGFSGNVGASVKAISAGVGISYSKTLAATNSYVGKPPKGNKKKYYRIIALIDAKKYYVCAGKYTHTACGRGVATKHVGNSYGYLYQPDLSIRHVAYDVETSNVKY